MQGGFDPNLGQITKVQKKKNISICIELEKVWQGRNLEGIPQQYRVHKAVPYLALGMVWYGRRLAGWFSLCPIGY